MGDFCIGFPSHTAMMETGKRNVTTATVITIKTITTITTTNSQYSCLNVTLARRIGSPVSSNICKSAHGGKKLCPLCLRYRGKGERAELTFAILG